MWRWWIFLWIPLLVEVAGVFGLRMVQLHIPEKVSPGQGVRMSCSYDLEGEELYSIKWYRDEVEFYRYVPIDRPPSQSFPLDGILIDESRSANGTVVIRELDTTASGLYRCEVSADAPSFQTVSAERILTVQETTDGQIQHTLNSFLFTSIFFLWSASLIRAF